MLKTCALINVLAALIRIHHTLAHMAAIASVKILTTPAHQLLRLDYASLDAVAMQMAANELIKIVI